LNAKTFFSDRVIAYHPVLAKVFGSVTSALFLSQLGYWSDKGADPSGWIWKTEAEMTEETGLSRSEQQTARDMLVWAGVLHEVRKGVPARMWFKIDWEMLDIALTEYENERAAKKAAEAVAQPVVENPQQEADIPQTIQRVQPEKKNNKTLSSMDSLQAGCWQELATLLVTYSPITVENFCDVWSRHPDIRRHKFALEQTRIYANPVSFRYYETTYLRYDPDKVKPTHSKQARPAAPVNGKSWDQMVIYD
jgi:hypothetical protein